MHFKCAQECMDDIYIYICSVTRVKTHVSIAKFMSQIILDGPV